jgi:type IV secretion system protein VirB10
MSSTPEVNPRNVNDGAVPVEPVHANDTIVSVNAKSARIGSNRTSKAAFILVASAALIGLLLWFGQAWVKAKKQSLKPDFAQAGVESPDLLNPEGTGKTMPKLKLGADGAPLTSSLQPKTRPPALESFDGIRPLRGADGKIVVNAQGRSMGVDREGNIVEVPAIAAIANDPAAIKPLPGQQMAMNGAGQQPPPKPPSRYGGDLFVSGQPKPGASSTPNAIAPGIPPGVGQLPAGSSAATIELYKDILRSVTGGAQGGAAGSPVAGLGGGVSASSPRPASALLGQPSSYSRPADGSSAGGEYQSRVGTVGNALYSSTTPVARATRFADQNLVLPKGRQADCILTGRIIDEVPGFTSCVLASNLYSDNGQVLLLERGSELSGEYGVANQPGSRRLFVTWNRVKTPQGVEVDLSSPGADALGTSGVPGVVDNRWPERVGAALILSFIKDVSVAVINSQTREKNTNGTSLTIQQQQPVGQNSVNTGFTLADEVVRQTIKTRPTITINEGSRISIYVARDLDFSPVYALKSGAGAVKVR